MSRRPSGNRPGRPLRYDAARCAAACELIREGSPVAVACREVGIDPRSFGRWVELDFDGLRDKFLRAQAICGLAWEAEILDYPESCFSLAKAERDWARFERHRAVLHTLAANLTTASGGGTEVVAVADPQPLPVNFDFAVPLGLLVTGVYGNLSYAEQGDGRWPGGDCSERCGGED